MRYSLRAHLARCMLHVRFALGPGVYTWCDLIICPLIFRVVVQWCVAQGGDQGATTYRQPAALQATVWFVDCYEHQPV